MPVFAIDLAHPEFRIDAKRAGKRHPTLLTDDLPDLLDRILENPECGDRIPRLPEEVRKARVGVRQQNIGARGAYRLIYLVDRKDSIIQPLDLYYKADVPDMTHRAIAEKLSRR